jgi:hypothetical protein
MVAAPQSLIASSFFYIPVPATEKFVMSNHHLDPAYFVEIYSIQRAHILAHQKSSDYELFRKSTTSQAQLNIEL